MQQSKVNIIFIYNSFLHLIIKIIINYSQTEDPSKQVMEALNII